MREEIKLLFQQLPSNNTSRIIYYKGKDRILKTYREFSADVDAALARLDSLSASAGIRVVGIIGGLGYQWMVLDYACMKGGYKSVAIPETMPANTVSELIDETRVDLLLVDHALKQDYREISKVRAYFFNADDCSDPSLFSSVEAVANTYRPIEILKEYSIGFSAGTTEKIKQIKLVFPEPRKQPPARRNLFSKVTGYFSYLRHKREFRFWYRKDNRFIVFMPFSHIQQRKFVQTALQGKIDIIISDPVNSLKHIILEKPNIMVSVPLFYEAIAERIRTKVERFSPFKKILFCLFNTLRINRCHNDNLVKKLFSAILFKDIRKIYGGRADYFITGSAPIDPAALRTFYSVGVKIYEAYGQSEAEIISMNTMRNFRIGSVGKPFLSVRIAADSEVLVKYDDYRHSENKSILDINEGYIHTGDLGYLDKHGYLYITGRKDDVIILNNGKKVHPAPIERQLAREGKVDHAILISPDNNNLSVIIASQYPGEISSSKIKGVIGELNKRLSSYEQIKSYCISPEPFTPGNGLLTATFKPKRKSILRRFAEAEGFLPV